MNIFKSYKRTKFFLWINIIGLSIGLAVSIMLVLYVVDQLSFDKHFKNRDRIVRLLTVAEKEGERTYYPINLLKAYSEVPPKVPGIEAAVEVYDLYNIEVKYDDKRFVRVRTLAVEPEFTQVFQLKFLEGTPVAALSFPTSSVITRQQAEAIFGGVEQAMNKTITAYDIEFTVTAVVEELPKNTHFQFDILVNINCNPWFKDTGGGLEYHTYYLIKKDASIPATREAIEKEYTTLLEPWGERTGREAYGKTEMLDDVYLNSKAPYNLNKKGDVMYIWVMTILALLILVLAITNFINLYISQGELRMNEIAIRKTNGGQISDIIRQFFGEVSIIVFIAFVFGFFLALLCINYVIPLIDLKQLASPLFILSILVLFIITVVCSAFYPAFYLSKFTPLEILGRRIKLSKRQQTAGIVIFQSILSIILMSCILIMYKQTSYLEKMPLGYNPNQVMTVMSNSSLVQSFPAVKEELQKLPIVHSVAGSHHLFSDGYSGQIIATWENRDETRAINEYRVETGFPELMELELVEGRFWNENDPDSIRMIILNEAAVKMLGVKDPLETTYDFFGEAKLTGVVKDFYYGNPLLGIEPVVLRRIFNPSLINIRFNEGVDRKQAEEATLVVLRRFDSQFMTAPEWSTDIYNGKISEIKQYNKVLSIAAALSIFIAMLGLLAIHLYSSIRRTKEIAIRRIHGAEKGSVFRLLSLSILKWIGIAAVFATPIAWYLIREVLYNYTNHVSVDWTIFALPIVAQCIIALLTTSGVTLWVLSRNPASSINSNQ